MAWDDTKVTNDDFLSADWNSMVTDQKSRSKVYSGIVTPIGAVTPESVGDIYIDTALELAYIATGTANTNWELIDYAAPVWGTFTGTLSNQTDLQTALDGKVDENSAITGATKTKITYDAKGLVTSGTDATTADIAASTDKNYVTDAEKIVIGNTSNTNTGDQVAGDFAHDSLASITGTVGQYNHPTDANMTVLNNTSNTNTGDQTDMSGITDTKANFNSACTDGTFLYSGDITQYTDEMAQDAIGAMVDTTLTYTDGTPELKVTNPVTPIATGFTITAGTTPKTLTVPDTASVSGTNTGDQTSSDFSHDNLSGLTGTAGQYNHPTDAQMIVLGNTSNTNTGDNPGVTSVAGGTGLTSTGGNTPSLSHDSHTGDATGATALTLATVNSDVGSFTAANITVNAKGLITAAANGSVGMTDPMTTRGDIIYKNASNVTDRLGAGSAGQYLYSDGTDLSWNTPAGGGDVVKVGTPVDSQIGVWTGDGTIEGHTSFTYDRSNMQFTGDLGSTGTRITKGWFTDLEVTNAIAGSVTGNAATVTGFTPASGSLTLAGADAVTLTTSAATSVTLPTSGTLLANVSEDTTPELGGELDAGAHSIGFTQQSSTGDGTTTINWTLGNKYFFTFGAQNDTFTFTAPSNPCNLLLVLKQDGTGSRTATWPASVKWAGGSAPTLTTDADAVDIVSFYYDGTNYYGLGALDFS